MNSMSAILGQYDAACRGLKKLMVQFEEASDGPESFPPLFHQLIWFNEPMTDNQLSAFKKANTKPGGDWQKWDVYPDGNPCGRFCGNEIGYEPFITMAKRGIEMLTRISKLRHAEGVVLPGDLVLELPEFGGHMAWVYLLYDTARAFSTQVLNAEPANWGCTGQLNYREDITWETNSEGISFPVHPAYEKLSCNVFKASAEAISLWLDHDEAERVGEIFGEPTIYLPPEPEENGPVPPDTFWLWGMAYQPFTREEWLLLDGLWGKEWVTTDELIRHVWGDEDEKEGSLDSLYKRLNATLRKMRCPARITKDKEWFRFVPKPPPTKLPAVPQDGAVEGHTGS